ncbi:uncharacterized protein RCC_11490 [Ramularia collo-cygni]|uniref:Oxidase ustYa n=1 Tax=Ramularia collo-cygni TaxID=112498 RepID=A0A2D3V8J5_9PEZI|nr:uncharacterized protein RCC_11490 [Ramularia collo-cygni]CZT25821.1 uncharacterized protein RCC_11490 [Ramularia collo-cygni]
MQFLQENKQAFYYEIEDEEQSHRETDHSWRPFAYILFALLCCATSFFAGTRLGLAKTRHAASSPIPWIPEALVTFESNSRYGGPSSPESDEFWTSLSPPGEGFVLIDDPSGWDLPPGKTTAQGELYDVAVFHQLHCLTKIREHASLLRFALGKNDTAGFHKIISPQVDHMAHCFDYLRQSIMCAGDLTLEWPKEGSNGEHLVVDGWGVQHQCKDWNAISEFVAKNSPTLR